MRIVRWIRYLLIETLISIGNWSILVSFLISFVISVIIVMCVLQVYTLSGKIDEILSWHIIGIMFGSVYIPIQSAVFNKVLCEWNNGILAQKWMYGMSRFTIMLIDNVVDSAIFIALLTLLCIVVLGIVPSQISVSNIVISVTILVPPIIATTRLYSTLLTKNTISSIVGVVALVPILPSLTISINVISTKHLVWHDIIIGIAYCVFCIVAYSLVNWLISIYVEITV